MVVLGRLGLVRNDDRQQIMVQRDGTLPSALNFRIDTLFVNDGISIPSLTVVDFGHPYTIVETVQFNDTPRAVEAGFTRGDGVLTDAQEKASTAQREGVTEADGSRTPAEEAGDTEYVRPFGRDAAQAIELPVAAAGDDRTAMSSGVKVDYAADVSPEITRAFTPSDDLFLNQWHLLNTGQFVGSVAGIDIDVTDVWDDYTGAGIRVGVVDDGVEYTHHDLNDNYVASGEFDYGGNDSDPFPGTNDPHGTAVAGLIAAENNGVGTVGVAFDASITAFRIFGGSVTEAEFADVFNRHAVELDISNNSWGFNGFFFDNFDSTTFDAVGLAVENAAANGRGGLGTVMLWAAGNDRTEGQDVNYHSFQNARETISVAAITNQGEIAAYSTPGAAILVGAPSNGGTAGITTTDRVGAPGYSNGGDYTFGFGGTSAATPITAGAVALILEANPLLGYRDVQEILAYTARQVDESDPGWVYNGAHNWNGGGLHTSHDFGFGLIDTHAAVRHAETWTAQSTAANEGLVTGSSAPHLALIDNGTISDTITIGGGIDIEHVEVVLDLTHTFIGDLVITLTAPDGTQSVLVNRPGVTAGNPNGASQDNINFTLSSTNHWGETGIGDWTLEVEDAAAGDTGTLVSWTLNLFGAALSDDDFYVYTDEFAGFTSDLGRQILSDAAGADVINAAAIRANSVIDLTDGSDSTLAGNTLTIESGTIIEDAYSGDGDDFL
ncbi:MAG: S8 family peptidase, partial [Rhodospirillaceae bacterium]|nr:S8 family peptidase [Rhodospirillaceae bacterium]